ncbi:hypothetical protein ACOME3_000654 [Neoechinorhynchus agilis]
MDDRYLNSTYLYNGQSQYYATSYYPVPDSSLVKCCYQGHSNNSACRQEFMDQSVHCKNKMHFTSPPEHYFTVGFNQDCYHQHNSYAFNYLSEEYSRNSELKEDPQINCTQQSAILNSSRNDVNAFMFPDKTNVPRFEEGTNISAEFSNAKEKLFRTRRTRTKFSQSQLAFLNDKFRLVQHPDIKQREIYAARTGLSTNCILIWFKNRRAKERRYRQISSANC